MVHGPDEFEEIFELSASGKPLERYSSARLKRVRWDLPFGAANVLSGHLAKWRHMREEDRDRDFWERKAPQYRPRCKEPAGADCRCPASWNSPPAAYPVRAQCWRSRRGRAL